ncbi:MAG: hypothetical protein JSR73_17180 [Proteobacteria bacterium]|nr:hypothetical protein [Pseudomonadota bacterium]
MNAQTEARFDATSVYREELYTDRRVGSIRALVPVLADGAADPSRPTLYVGQISVMTPMGTLPISFEIDGATLADAIKGFADGARLAMDDAMRELQQMRREAASSIVIPEPGAVPPAGGGRIRMP